MPDNTNRVGLGIDLDAGQETLATLRNIRFEMQAISQLSARGGTGGSRSGNSKGATAGSPSDPDQLRLFSDGIARQQSLFSQAEIEKTRIVEREGAKRRGFRQSQLSEEAQFEIRMEKEKQNARYKTFKDTVAQEEELARIQRSNKRVGIRGGATEGRTALANEVDDINTRTQRAIQSLKVLQEQAAKLKVDISPAYDAASPRAAAARARSIIDERRAVLDQEAERVRQQRNNVGYYKNNTLSNPDDRADSDYQKKVFQNARNQPRDQTTQEWRDDFAAQRQAMRERINERRVADREYLATVKKGGEEYQAELNQRLTNEERFIVRSNRMWAQGARGQGPGVPSPGGGTGGGARGPEIPSNLEREFTNPKGFFTTGDVLARITRNLLIYQGVRQVTFGLVEYIKSAAEAAQKADDYATALEFATKASGTNLAANQATAESLRSVGISRSSGRDIVTQALRFGDDIEGNFTPDAAKLTKIATNIASARGEGIDKVGETLDKLRKGQSRYYKEEFNVSVDEIYRRAVAPQAIADQALTISDKKKDYKDDEKAIKAYVAALSESEKARLRYNFILEQGARYEGEADKRAQSLAGRFETLANRFKDGQEGVGEFIGEIKILNSVIATASDLFDKLSFSSNKLQKSGPGGTISNLDIANYVQGQTNGTRQAVLSGINDYALPVAGGIAATGILGLLGRGNARRSYKTNVYTDTLADAQASGLSESESLARAKLIASDAKPGLLRSVGAGMRRITVGLNDSILDLTSSMANTIGADTLASKAKLAQTTREGLTRVRGAVPRPGNDAYFQEKLDREAGRVSGGTVGGLIGAGVGAEIGNQLAQSQGYGAIGSTIIAGIGGAIFSQLGSLVGKGAGGFVARGGLAEGASIIGATELAGLVGGAAVTAPFAAVGLGLAAYSSQQRQYAEQNVAFQTALSVGYGAQQTQRLQAEREGRLSYRSLKAGDTLEALSPDEVRARVASGQNVREDFFQVADHLTGETKKITDTFGNVISIIASNATIMTEAEVKARENHEKLLKTIGTAVIGDDGKDAGSDLRTRGQQYDADREAKAKQLKDKQEQERVNDQSRALAKLRETAAGSFQNIYEDAGNATGGDNPFVKIYADQATAAQRMSQSFGFLGKEQENYHLKLELTRNALAEVNANFDVFNKVTDIQNKVFREGRDRNGPGLNTRQTLAGDLTQAYADEIKVIGQTRLSDAAITGLGPGTDSIRFAKEQLRQIGYLGLGSGATNRQIRDIQTASSDEALQGLTSQQIANDPYLRSIALGNNRNRRDAAGDRINDEIQKARLNASEEDLLASNLSGAAAEKDRLIREGKDPRRAEYAQQALDKYIIGRTDNIPVKDLTAVQFQQREDALKRSAKDEVDKAAEAKKAVEEGLAYQKALVELLAGLREDIIGGNASVIIKVLNDTLARLDKEALEDSNPGYKVPLNDGHRTNPYSNLFNKYGRGGGKR